MVRAASGAAWRMPPGFPWRKNPQQVGFFRMLRLRTGFPTAAGADLVVLSRVTCREGVGHFHIQVVMNSRGCLVNALHCLQSNGFLGVTHGKKGNCSLGWYRNRAAELITSSWSHKRALIQELPD